MNRVLVLSSGAIGAILVLWLGRGLPDRVASHFGPSGVADSFMPRPMFLGLMLAVTAVLPVLVWLMQIRAAKNKTAKIPNAEYWLSPERRASTVAFIEAHAAIFSVSLTAFMVYVTWAVVGANEPTGHLPALNIKSFLLSVGLFLLFTVGWVGYLRVHFRRDA